MLKKRMATKIVVIALALGIALLFPACNKNKKDYSGLLKGDFSVVAGTYVNGSGYKTELNADGTFDYRDLWLASAASYGEVYEGWSKTYNWQISPPPGADASGVPWVLWPVGVEVLVDGKIVKTDTSKERLAIAGFDPPTAEELLAWLYYRETSDKSANVTWRKEFKPGGIDMGTTWRSDNNHLYFNDDADMDFMGNPKEKNTVSAMPNLNIYDAQSWTYKLVSKDDKPAGQVSSFTIEEQGKKYTVKYTLGAGGAEIITITDNSGLDYVPKGTYIKRYYGHDDTGERPYYNSYLQQLETALKKVKDEKAAEWQIKEIESAIAQLNQWWENSTTIRMEKSADTPSYYYATTNLRLRSEPDASKDNRIASVPQGSKS